MSTHMLPWKNKTNIKIFGKKNKVLSHLEKKFSLEVVDGNTLFPLHDYYYTICIDGKFTFNSISYVCKDIFNFVNRYVKLSCRH